MPHERTVVSGSTTQPEVWTERGGSAAAPSERREMSPPTREQEAGSKRPRLDVVEQGSGDSPPKHIRHPIALM